MTDLNKFLKCDVFTPDNISNLMANKLHKKGNLLEPSVGTGNLLKFIDLDIYDNIDVYELKDEYLKQIHKEKINKYNCDFLKQKINKKYNNIILNPPYIKVQDLSSEYRTFIKKEFNILKNGILDIYYAFLIKCIDLLEDDGIMVSITPNSYLYNKSALKLRKYLFDNGFIQEIIDFGSKKVFKGTSVYCCITIFTKKSKNSITYNDKKININNIINNNYNIFYINNTNNSKTLKDICKISNGIATLRDKIFIHKTKLFDEPCWKEITNSRENKFIIYPYVDGKIINEISFKRDNPNTYEYLTSNKTELAKRDKGNKKYPAWYAFGRSQSLKISKKEKVIYLPTLVSPDDFNMKISSPMLFHACLRIEPNDINDINLIVTIINKNKKNIEKISPKRSSGWITLSSTNLYKIPLNN